MNLLVLTHRLPYPPHDGHRLRVYHLTRQLSRRHRLTLITFIDSPEELNHLPELKTYFQEVYAVERSVRRGLLPRLANLFQAYPYAVAQHETGPMADRIVERVAEAGFDAALVFNMEMAGYVRCLGELPRVIDAVDAVSEVSRQKIWRTGNPVEKLKAVIDWRKMKSYEAKAYLDFHLTLLTTPSDRDALLKRCPRLRAKVLPNGVDAEYFRPLGGEQAFPSLIFTGAMDYYPNRDAVLYFSQRIFPLILRERPEVRFFVVGGDPKGELRRRVERRENTVVMGFVDDLRPCLDAATIFVCPMRMGMGIKNKLLEAMAMGKPVVCSPQSLSGIQAAPGTEVMVAEDARGFANAVLRLLGDQSERERLGAAARRAAVEKHSWRRVGETLDDYIGAVVAAKKGG